MSGTGVIHNSVGELSRFCIGAYGNVAAVSITEFVR